MLCSSLAGSCNALFSHTLFSHAPYSRYVFLCAPPLLRRVHEDAGRDESEQEGPLCWGTAQCFPSSHDHCCFCCCAMKNARALSQFSCSEIPWNVCQSDYVSLSVLRSSVYSHLWLFGSLAAPWLIRQPFLTHRFGLMYVLTLSSVLFSFRNSYWPWPTSRRSAMAASHAPRAKHGSVNCNGRISSDQTLLWSCRGSIRIRQARDLLLS